MAACIAGGCFRLFGRCCFHHGAFLLLYLTVERLKACFTLQSIVSRFIFVDVRY